MTQSLHDRQRVIARAALASLLALALALLSLAGTSHAQTSPGESPDTVEIEGPNRTDTAIQAAELGFPDGADTVVFGRNDVAPDSLAGGALAGAVDGPILLVPTDDDEDEEGSRGELEKVAEAIENLDASEGIVLGGEAAISEDVRAFLEDETDLDDVARVGGRDRFETALLISEEVQDRDPDAAQLANPVEVDGQQADSAAFLARADDFADALAAGPGAYTGSHPTLLTRSEELHPDADEGLEELGPDLVYILGGDAAIDDDVEEELEDQGYLVRRLFGPDRSDTAVEVAQELEGPGFELDPANVGLATGENFPDALASAPYLGENIAPLVLARGADLPEATEIYLNERQCTIEALHFFGGDGAISQDVRDEAVAAAACPPGDVETAVQLNWQSEVDQNDLEGFGAVDDLAARTHPDDGSGTIMMEWDGDHPAGPFLTVSGEFVATDDIAEDIAGGFHLHEGAVDDNGGVIVPFDPPEETDSEPIEGTDRELKTFAVDQTVTEDDQGDLGDVIDDLDEAFDETDEGEVVDFYLNVHTETNQGGEIRGQLQAVNFVDDEDAEIDGGLSELPPVYKQVDVESTNVLALGFDIDVEADGILTDDDVTVTDSSGDVTVLAGIDSGGDVFVVTDDELAVGEVTVEIEDSGAALITGVDEERDDDVTESVRVRATEVEEDEDEEVGEELQQRLDEALEDAS